MNREEIEDFKRSIPGMIPQEQRNAGAILGYLGEYAERVARLSREYTPQSEALSVEEIKRLGMEERFENAAILFLRSIGYHFFEAKQGRKRSTHFLH